MHLEALVQQHYEHMSGSDHLIWQYISSHRKKCLTMTLQQLADACQVSHTSVLRFIQLLGMDGFSEFKVFLKWEDRRRATPDVHHVEKVCYDLSRTITMAETMNCKELFHKMDQAKNIYAYGSGSLQKYAAYMLKNCLIAEGKLVHVIEGREECSMALGQMKADDVVFLFSLSGNNTSVVEYAERLHRRNVYLAGICQSGENELTKRCDFSIQFHSRTLEVGQNAVHYQSVSGMFSIVEILALHYAAHQAES